MITKFQISHPEACQIITTCSNAKTQQTYCSFVIRNIWIKLKFWRNKDIHSSIIIMINQNGMSDKSKYSCHADSRWNFFMRSLVGSHYITKINSPFSILLVKGSQKCFSCSQFRIHAHKTMWHPHTFSLCHPYISCCPFSSTLYISSSLNRGDKYQKKNKK